MPRVFTPQHILKQPYWEELHPSFKTNFSDVMANLVLALNDEGRHIWGVDDNNDEQNSCIGEYFSWDSSPQGFSYWQKIQCVTRPREYG